jgi:hypothetical protein
MRRSGWTPSIVPNDRKRNIFSGDRDVVHADIGRFEYPMPAAYFQTLERPQRRSDLAFLVGTTIALALPGILGLTVYLATHALLWAT